MDLTKLDVLLRRRHQRKHEATDTAADVKYVGMKRVKPNVISNSRKYRGQWHKPEYDFKTLQIAQHGESFILQIIRKKADRLMLAGFEFVGKNDDPVQYVKNRIKQMELVRNKPFKLLLRETAEDLLRQSNCMWAKVRSTESSSGEVRVDISGKEVDPVAAYYILPMEQLEFKTKVNGEFKKIKQVSLDGQYREFAPIDVIHFYTDLKPGFTVGTPSLLPALDDVALLRRIEENVEELIETNLFPSYHYRVGTDTMPERNTPQGTEAEIVKRNIEYMPAGSVYVSDHRHEITAIGSEGKALTIDMYLEYFKKRAIASVGGTEVDLGIDGDANRSTANTLSKVTLMDIEALGHAMTEFINFYVINELLLEGGYDPFDPENEVSIRFGVIDVEQRMTQENQIIQLFTNKLLALDEAREALGYKPVQENEDWLEGTYFKLFEEPLALAKGVGTPGSAATETLAGTPSSNITPEAANKEKQFAKEQVKAQAKAKAAGQAGRRPNGSSTGQRRASAAKSRPSNQRGTRAAPKTNRDLTLNISGAVASISLDFDINEQRAQHLASLITDRYNLVKDLGVSLQTVADSMRHRLLE